MAQLVARGRSTRCDAARLAGGLGGGGGGAPG